MKQLLLWVGVALLASFVGCSSETPYGDDPSPSAASTVQMASEDEDDETYPHAPVQLIDQGNSTLLPLVEPMRRARQRMTIDQLSATLTQVSGGIGWTEMQGSAEVNLFDTFASSLGVPDYVEVTREDRSASALFHKFLDEAARHVCAEMVSRETGDGPTEPQLMKHASPTDTLQTNPEAIDANLRYLLLRYHGRKVGVDGVALNTWRWLFETVTHVSGDPAIGSRAVFVGLVSHPDFYSF